MKLISVVGARPNFMKIAPIIKEFSKHKEIQNILVHTGQHYDDNMSKDFFDVLNIPKPDINLEVGSGSNSWQTSEIIKRFEKVCVEYKPDLVIVVGDVNSTLACSIVAKQLNIKLAHVEAGLRSFDMTMPEEINRRVTDNLTDILFVTEQAGVDNLLNEGISKEKIFFVGDVMIDALVSELDKIKNAKTIQKYNLNRGTYAVSTLHRPVNVDNKENLLEILDAFKSIQEKIRIILPMHPRTKKNIDRFGLNDKMKSMKNLIITEPLDYVNFMNLVMNSKFVLSDSGGIQSETTYLGIPCITLRETTEKPVTLNEGTNVIVGNDKEKIILESIKVLNGDIQNHKIPELWDGKTAKRIVEVILK